MKSTGRFTKKLREIYHYCHNKCSICEGDLPRDIPAFAGYDKSTNEIYVGNCCVDKIDELASHIYWWWTNYKRPQRDELMWRYMDFAKFVSMLQNNSLYFSRADKFEDVFEGARGTLSREGTWKNHYLDFFKNAIKEAPNVTATPVDEEWVNREAYKLYEDFCQIGKHELTNTFINCWHSSSVESEALWRIYGSNSPYSIAIKTTFGDLVDSLDTDHDLKFGHVNYVDFDKSFSGVYDRFFYKRKSLEYEKEVRGVIFLGHGHNSQTSSGININLKLDKAIHSVILSPNSPQWFEDTVVKTIKNYGFNISVAKSSLLALPFY